ncbi:MAG: CusA/CzcA family heavy metal efflux RND transporter [Polyangiales bacterium]
MIEAIVRWSVRNRGLVAGVVAIFAIGGILAGSLLRFDALPDVTGKQVIVLTQAPGLTPEEVELLVTRPVEMALGGLPGSKTQRSISRYGLSSVTMVFEEHVDLLRARQLVQERLFTVQGSMPPGVGAPELGPLTGGLGEIYQFTVSSPGRSPAELLELVRFRVAPILRAVPGVVEVNSWGGERRTMDVVGDPARMTRYGVTLAQLTDATRQGTGYAAGATLDAGTSGVLLRGVAWPKRPSELAAAVVGSVEGDVPIRIGDVADVLESAAVRIGAATADGRGETVYVMVQMVLEANALEVLGRVKAKMPQVQNALPRDVAIQVVYDRSELVDATLRTVFANLLEGGLLVVGVLFVLLGSFRAGALVASVIPLSMLGAVTGMVLLDVPGNLMSLGALDFGLLVDGAVVMVEAVFHAAHERGGRIADQVEDTAARMARPVFFAVLIIILVYIPILSLTGVEGKMYRPMALTVLLALLSALVLSLTYVPAMSRLILRDQDVPARPPWLVRWVSRKYAPLLDWAVRHPRKVVSSAAVLLVIGAWLAAVAGSAFVPQLDEGDLVVQTVRDADIQVHTAVSDNTRMEAAILQAVPEARHIASRIGSPEVATDIMGREQADVFVDLAPRSEWREGVSRDQIIAEISQAIARSAPAQEVAFTQPIQMRFNELVGGSVTDVSLSIYGEDLSVLHAFANEVVAALSSVPGAEDVRVLAPPSVGLLEVVPKPLEASRVGFRSEDVLEHVRAARAGIVTGTTYDGPVQIPVRVRLGKHPDALSFEQFLLPTRQGSLVALSQVAQVNHARGPALVNHEMAQRRVIVGMNVRGRDLGSVVHDAQAMLDDPKLQPPEGAVLAWGGQYESLERAKKRLNLIIPAVLFLMLALLLGLFRRLSPALMILLNVPFAAVGGIVALSARGLPISVSAVVGFIALSGIAVLNGVVLVSALMTELEEGVDVVEAVRRAAQSRLRPVLMTALVAALGFVPMMLATGVGAEVQRPLATVVVGGLVTSTLLTLVILPAIVPPVFARTVSAADRPTAATSHPS